MIETVHVASSTKLANDRWLPLFAGDVSLKTKENGVGGGKRNGRQEITATVHRLLAPKTKGKWKTEWKNRPAQNTKSERERQKEREREPMTFLISDGNNSSNRSSNNKNNSNNNSNDRSRKKLPANRKFWRFFLFPTRAFLVGMNFFVPGAS